MKSTVLPLWPMGKLPFSLSAPLCFVCAMSLAPSGQIQAESSTSQHPEWMEQTPQQRQVGVRVKGVVRDQNGEPLSGVVIRDESNPRTATVSDSNGRFSLGGVRGKHITVHYVGFATQTVAVGNGQIDVQLKESNNNLAEAVVVGYGKQAKANLTGSVAQIKSEELQARPVQNVSSALQGLMPGVTITSGQGRPGQDGSTIRVRGVGTLNNSNPYILVDGIETGTLNSLDPNDIESISVLKDAASAAIYGSKASNGVILITTKRGKVGRPVVTYNGNVGFLNATKLVERLGSGEYAKMLNDALKSNGKQPRWSEEAIKKFNEGSDPDNYPNSDWYGEAFKTGVQHTHSFNVTGGTDAVKYMAAASYMDQEGILASSGRQKFNMRTNLDFTFSPRFTGHAGINYIKDSNQDPNNNYVGGGSDQIIRQLNIIAPWIAARKSDGTWGTIGDGNPIAWLDQNQPVKRDNSYVTANLGLDYKLMEGLAVSVKFSHLSGGQHYKAFLKEFAYNPNKRTNPNNLNEAYFDWQRNNFDALLNYDKQVGVHGFKLLAGYHAEAYDYNELSGYRKNFAGNALSDMNAGDASSSTNGGYSRQLNMMSWFGRFNYDLMGRYLFEANLRSDASSRFAKGHRWGTFPSFSAAWRLSAEEFMQPTRDWLSYLKLRASWGLLGNQDALNDYYPALNVYNTDALAILGGTPTPGYYQKSYKMKSISWEKSRTWGVGVDFEVFGHLSGSLDYYDRETTGIIMKVPAPAEFQLGDYYDNVGAMRNRGVELSLSYNQSWGDWKFGIQGNVSYNKNELLNLGGVQSAMIDRTKRREIGYALDSYYVYETAGFFASDEAAKAWMKQYKDQPDYPFGSYEFRGGDLIYRDTNGDGKMTVDDRTMHNSSTPAWVFGAVLNASWRNFDFQAIFSGYAQSARIINEEVYGDFRGDNSHPSTIWRDSWTYNPTNAQMPRISESNTSYSHPHKVMSDFWLANTSHLRLKNLQLGYTLPTAWAKALGTSKVRFYYSVENLLTIDAMKVNIDPEISSERGSSYPLVRTNSLGLSITF